MDVFSNFFSSSFQQGNVEGAGACLPFHEAVFNIVPQSHQDVNAVFVKNNLALIPGEWESGALASSLYDITPTEPCMAEVLTTFKTSEFIAYDDSFFSLLGSNAKVEKIQSFPKDKQNVHEAPIYLSETNELLYSDTSLVGTLFAINIDTHAVREVHSEPPLANVNGGTRHKDGTIYLATNGGSVRGIFTLNITTGKAEAILNNYRGRHFNSPNDLIFDSKGNLYFTDPTYGQAQGWPGVQEAELPNAIYRFNPKTKAITALSNSALPMPNGLAFSPDEKTLYVADSSSTSGQPASQRAVFAFDVRSDGLLESPRLVHQLESGWPDGVRVTRSGLLVIGVAGGADIVDPTTGVLLGKINTPDDVIFNLEPARGTGVWLLTGQKHVYKVKIRETAVERGRLGNLGLGIESWVQRAQDLIGFERVR